MLNLLQISPMDRHITKSQPRGLLASFLNLMLEYDGRIGRLPFWLGLVATIAITSFFGTMAEYVVTGFGEIGRYVAFLSILGLLIWMHSAVTVKRLHDRNRPGLWYFIYGLGPQGFFLWAVYLHASGNVTVASLFYVISAIGLLWSVIELGLLRGTVGPNRHGPDPADA